MDRTHVLKHPVTINTTGGNAEVITEVTLRRPTGGDLLATDSLRGKPVALKLKMIQLLGGLMDHELRRIDVEDIAALDKLAMKGVKTDQTADDIAAIIQKRSYVLKYPIATASRGPDGGQTETVSEVTLRRPTAADLLLLDDYEGQPMALMLLMVQQLSGLSDREVRQMDAEDIGPLGDIAMDGV